MCVIHPCKLPLINENKDEHLTKHLKTKQNNINEQEKNCTIKTRFMKKWNRINKLK